MDGAAGRALGVGEQAHAVAELGERADVGPGHVADPHAVDGVGCDVDAEREPGEDHQLVDGVPAVDVERRVRFGKAATLGIGERALEADARRRASG